MFILVTYVAYKEDESEVSNIKPECLEDFAEMVEDNSQQTAVITKDKTTCWDFWNIMKMSV